MLAEAEIFSDLIGTIYDTTLDRNLWPEALRKLAEFVGGPAATIFSKNPSSRNGSAYFDFGVDPHFRQLYFDKYVKLDPATTGHCFAEIGHPIATADLLPYAEFLETRFYKEWAAPQGLVDFVSAVLDKSANNAALFGVFRHERNGVVDDETRRRMRLIVPHIRRAVLIGNVLDIDTTKAAALADTLNGLAAGVFLVDENARVEFANMSGRAMLGEGKILRQKDGVLTAVDPKRAATLSDVIVAARGGDAAVGTSGIAVPLSSPPAEQWLAHVLPLTSGTRQHAGISYSAVAAVFVHKASLETPSSMETMSKLYRLTPSELRVLVAVSEFGGVAAVASVVGTSEATVKTHLQHLFAKTGTSRQIDLVKLVAAHASPLRQAT
ncbi:MAG: LuxR family transcriptional regulator [Xanthobacteraceae bacterium]|nr:LuxR family transcriptional regulator [Xanthobacteraceae bacterium]